MNDLSRRPKVLVIGPVPPQSASTTNPIGGTAVHFRETIRELTRRAVAFQVIDTTRHRVNIGRVGFVFHAVTKVLRIVYATLRKTRSCDVVFLNLAAGRLWILGPLIWIICTVLSRPMLLRVFGGEFGEVYDSYSVLIRWLADRTYMRCHRIYVQTHLITRRFAHRSNIKWLPNTRNIHACSTRTPSTAERFLFVSQLRPEKGLHQAIEACRDLPVRCHLFVYGPNVGSFDIESISGYERVSYEGVLDPQDVPGVIADHDVILLPTYFKSEGYPGIIIEAFQCGRPVISTWWKSIPEIVQHQSNGLLVTPRSTAELRAAVLRLASDSLLYRTLRDGARQRGEFFRSSRWYDRLVDDLTSVVDVREGYL